MNTTFSLTVWQRRNTHSKIYHTEIRNDRHLYDPGPGWKLVLKRSRPYRGPTWFEHCPLLHKLFANMKISEK